MKFNTNTDELTAESGGSTTDRGGVAAADDMRETGRDSFAMETSSIGPERMSGKELPEMRESQGVNKIHSNEY